MATSTPTPAKPWRTPSRGGSRRRCSGVGAQPDQQLAARDRARADRARRCTSRSAGPRCWSPRSTSRARSPSRRWASSPRSSGRGGCSWPGSCSCSPAGVVGGLGDRPDDADRRARPGRDRHLGRVSVGDAADPPAGRCRRPRRAAGQRARGTAIAGEATAALGLPIGGVLVGAFGWRATFLVNVPVALLTLAWRWPGSPPTRRSRAPRRAASARARIDLAGSLGFGGRDDRAARVPARRCRTRAGSRWRRRSCSAPASVALGAARRDPFFDVRLLVSNRALTRTYLRWALTLLGIYTVLYGITQWIRPDAACRRAGRPAAPADDRVAAVLSRAGLAAQPGPRPADRRRAWRCLAGSAVVLLLTTSTPIVWIVVVTLLFGITLGRGGQRQPDRPVHAGRRPSSSAPPRACSAPSATSARSRPRRSSASSSTPVSPITACTSSR